MYSSLKHLKSEKSKRLTKLLSEMVEKEEENLKQEIMVDIDKHKTLSVKWKQLIKWLVYKLVIVCLTTTTL